MTEQTINQRAANRSASTDDLRQALAAALEEARHLHVGRPSLETELAPLLARLEAIGRELDLLQAAPTSPWSVKPHPIWTQLPPPTAC